VYYSTLVNLIESLEQARAAGQLARRLRVLSHPALLVVDEIGYLPVNRDGAVLLFQLIDARYEHASTVLTSNKGFEEWGDILGDEVMAAALIDRLMHHCHVVNIRGNSYIIYPIAGGRGCASTPTFGMRFSPKPMNR
jgi:DNA replication protein DnaC